LGRDRGIAEAPDGDHRNADDCAPRRHKEEAIM
jgi:hypothetical protein